MIFLLNVSSKFLEIWFKCLRMVGWNNVDNVKIVFVIFFYFGRLKLFYGIMIFK